jgi:hypothetical protein
MRKQQSAPKPRRKPSASGRANEGLPEGQMPTGIYEVLQRREQAERLRDEFLSELSLACGRPIEADDLTLQLYEAARNSNSELPEYDFTWYVKCAYLLDILSSKIAHANQFRIRSAQFSFSDSDANLAWFWAKEFFHQDKEFLMRVSPNLVTVQRNLAVCLLDHCFISLDAQSLKPKANLPDLTPNQKIKNRGLHRLDQAVRMTVIIGGLLALFLVPRAEVFFILVLAALMMTLDTTER